MKYYSSQCILDTSSKAPLSRLRKIRILRSFFHARAGPDKLKAARTLSCPRGQAENTLWESIYGAAVGRGVPLTARQPFNELALGRDGGMHINIERHAHVSVAEYLALGFCVTAQAYAACGESVAQGVEVHLPQSRRAQHGVEPVLIGTGLNAALRAARKDKSSVVARGRAS